MAQRLQVALIIGAAAGPGDDVISISGWCTAQLTVGVCLQERGPYLLPGSAIAAFGGRGPLRIGCRSLPPGVLGTVPAAHCHARAAWCAAGSARFPGHLGALLGLADLLAVGTYDVAPVIKIGIGQGQPADHL